jgi:hypothetical protein
MRIKIDIKNKIIFLLKGEIENENKFNKRKKNKKKIGTRNLDLMMN